MTNWEKLADWMSANGWRDADLAARLGRERSGITRVRGGGAPSAALAIEIERLSDGAIRAVEWPSAASEETAA